MTDDTSSTYSYFENLETQIPAIPADTIVSRTLYNDSTVKIILFGFAQGQELSEHTSTQTATLQFISGKARLTLGEDTVEAGPGTLVHMPPRLPHSIVAITEVTMLLTMMAGSRNDDSS